MRRKQFLLPGAVMCLVASLFVVGASAKSRVRVRHVSKAKLFLYEKAVGGFKYNAKLNRWEGVEGMTSAGTDIAKKPVIFKPMLIGKQKVPAYYEAGNMMADPCDHSYIVITDKSYAIVFSADCGEDEKVLDNYAKSFTLPKGVHAVRAKEGAGWEVIE